MAGLACAIVYGVEHRVELLLEEEHSGRSPLTSSVFELSSIYQSVVTAGWRRPEPRITVIVEIDPGADPRLKTVSLFNVCDGRAYLASLIRRLGAAQPAVIVVDKSLDRDACLHRPEGTEELRKAVREVSASIPIVVGRRTLPSATARGDEPFELEPSVRLTRENGERVAEGMINIAWDTRRMALRWCGEVNATTGLTEPPRCETLALQAARLYEPLLFRKNPQLGPLLEQGTQPFISLIRVNEFCRIRSSAVLDPSERGEQTYAGLCPSARGRPSLEYLRGKIVMVGEVSADMDQHPSVVGNVSGHLIQAMYVEALLDSRYFKPAPWLDYVVGLALFAALKFVVLMSHRAPWRAIAIIALLLGSTYAAVIVLVLLLGFYVNPAGVGLLAVLLDASHIFIVWVWSKVGGGA